MKNFFDTEAGREYQRYNSRLKDRVLSFLPNKHVCSAIKDLGESGTWRYKNKTYSILDVKEKNKKLARAELCYDKRSSAIGLIISLSLFIIGIILFIVSYISQWKSFDEIIMMWNVASYFIISGTMLSIFYYLFWKRDHKKIKELEGVGK